MDGNNNGLGGENANNQQPQMDMGQQYQQPQMDMGQQYQQPQMDMGQQYQQPQMDMGQQYQQPQMDMGQQYQQSQVDMEQQNPYGYNPTPAPVGPKKSKGGAGKTIGIIVGAVVLIAAVVAGIIFIPKLLRDDKKIVMDAMEKTFNESTYNQAIENAIGISEIDPNSVAMDLTVIDVGGISELADLGFSYSSNTDNKNKKMNGNMGFSYQGQSLFSVDLAADEDKTYFQVPEVIDGYFSFNNKDFQNSFNNSYIGQNLPMDGFEGDLDYFEEGEASDDFDFEEIWDDVEFSKGKSEKVDVNGKEVKCDVYTGILPEEVFEEYLSTYMNSMVEALGESYSDIEFTEADIASMINGDIEYNFYIKGDEIKKMTFDCSFNVEGSKMNCSFEIILSGDKNPLDSYEGVLTITMDGAAVDLGFKGDLEKSSDSNKMTTLVNISVSGMDVYVATIEESFNLRTLETSFNITATPGSMFAGYGMPDISLLCSGSYKDVEKGSKYTLAFDSISLEVSGVQMASFQATYTVANNAKVTDMPVAIYDLNTMEEADFEALVIDNQEKMLNWIADVSTKEPVVLLMEIMGEEDILDDPAIGAPAIDEPVIDEPIGDIQEDGIIEAFEGNIEIVGMLPGFEKTYSSNYFKEYENADGVSVEYETEALTTKEELKAFFEDTMSYYLTVEGAVVKENFDEATGIYYMSVTIYDTGEIVMAGKQVTDKLYLVTTTIYVEGTFSLEEALQTLDDQYFRVVK